MDIPEYQMKMLLKNTSDRVKDSVQKNYLELPKRGEYSITFEAGGKLITLTFNIDSTEENREIHLHSPKY